MIKKLIVGLTLSTLLSFVAVNHFKALVLKKLNRYTSEEYPEKIYVQTDKPYYALGEDIWYTAYLVNGVTHKKSEKSRIIYTELINEQDSIVSRRELFVDHIGVAGDFKIEKNFKPGKYILRAYTNYMRNLDESYLFQKEISVWDVKDNTKKVNTPSATNLQNSNLSTIPDNKPEIYFYPEGGNLVTNLTSKIAIKSKNNKTLEGQIKDSDGNTLTHFKTQNFGIGLINLTPEANKSYYASIIINGKEQKYSLPKALPSGHNLNIANFSDKIIIKVTANHAIGLKNTYLVGHQRGNLIYEKFVPTAINEYSVMLDSKLLNDGVANFTLFDNNGKPVCERLVFIDTPNNNVDIQINLSNTTPKSREKVTMKLNLKDQNGSPLAGQFSMAITDLDAVDQKTTSENIKTYLLLNSDLRGTIENPGYFFEKKNDKRRSYQLDLIMLTHGWRRFQWTDLLFASPEKTKYSEEKGLYFSGYTTTLKNGKTRQASTTRMTFMGELPHQEQQQTASNGSFKYGPYIFNDSLPVLIEARTDHFKSEKDTGNRNLAIYLDQKYHDSPRIVKKEVLKPLLNDSTKITTFKEQAKTISQLDSLYHETATRLDEVLVTARMKSETAVRNEKLNERTNYGSPSKRLDMADFENLRHLSVIQLIGHLPGVITTGDSIYIRTELVTKIYVDESAVDVSDISTMTGSDIDFMDVLTGAAASMYSNAGPGVIIIHTRLGMYTNTNTKRKPGIINFTAKGFYSAREYYSPNYEDDFTIETKKDLRTTLHWEPLIELSEANDNESIVSFFTSDSKSTYGIKIEGITENGNPFCHLSTLEVD
ncbi:hypothetical protein Q4566_14215 [Tamlana sp. 2_MG-2023]|uniref:hypothetical protein n=1 Tax=unclassified Tamlana TaxID=2614803 RepID=UPI0026E2B1FD|nr:MULTISPECIES: hypothetical protein [unclassified Tamlana]MDO6761363.1 hypothetical protein [Tamlana sp. 2_MG-2023]MDO6792023.1 hypothetical protein [Tamlana sp. 1_MG-2023]